VTFVLQRKKNVLASVIVHVEINSFTGCYDNWHLE